MASKTISTFMLIEKKMDLEDLVERLMYCDHFALNCEPIALSCKNPISLMKIALDDGFIYLVDVQKLGLSGELEKILSNPNIRKVMVDCRGFAGTLKHQYGVKLEGIEDMQIMEYVIQNPDLSAACRLPSFSHLIFKYMGGQKIEQYNTLKLDEESTQWVNRLKSFVVVNRLRPLKKDLLDYASFKISCFFQLREKLMESLVNTEKEVAEWSVKYAASHMENALFDESNPYKSQSCVMPFNVLVESPLGYIPCTFCGIRLPESEFSKRALKKGKQKCKVCKEVMLVLVQEQKAKKNKQSRKRKVEKDQESECQCARCITTQSDVEVKGLYISSDDEMTD